MNRLTGALVLAAAVVAVIAAALLGDAFSLRSTLTAWMSGSTPAVPAGSTTDAENTLVMELDSGRVTIRLRPDLAPNHVARVKALARRGFYDGTPFHRVIDGFMAQGGDPTGTGSGGSDLPDLAAEFTDTPFTRGTIGAARTADPDSANSQFYIMLGRADWLDGQYTVWGEVIDGMDLVDRIAKGDPPDGIVASPDRIVSVRVAADAT
jgi:peptidylprolyl isomerase